MSDVEKEPHSPGEDSAWFEDEQDGLQARANTVSMDDYLGYKAPNIPSPNPALLKWVQLSTGSLPPGARYFFTIHCCYASHQTLNAKVSVRTMAKVCRIGSYNTVIKFLGMGVDIGLLEKQGNRQPFDRTPDSYVYLAEEWGYEPIPVGKPGVPSYLRDTYSLKRISELNYELNILRSLITNIEGPAFHFSLQRSEDDNQYSGLTMETVEGNPKELALPPDVLNRLRLEIYKELQRNPLMSTWKNPAYAVEQYLADPGQFRLQVQMAADMAKGEAKSPGGDFRRCQRCGEVYYPGEGDDGLCSDSCRSEEK